MSSLPPPPPAPVPTPTSSPGSTSAADPFTDLLHAVAAERVSEAAATRRRSHWLLRQSEQEGTFIGVLADLAERSESVVCTTHSGRRHVGRLHALGSDFVAVQGGSGAMVLVAMGAVAHIRTGPGTTTVTGDRVVQFDRLMVDVLAELAGDRPDVVVAAGSSEVRGELRAVGHDVMTLRLGGHPATTAYVALAVTDEVRVG